MLAEAHIDDVAGARVVDEQRRELLAARDRCHARLEALTADGDTAELRARLVELCPPGETGLFDLQADVATARAELDAAMAVHRQVIADCEKHRQLAQGAAKLLGERSTRASVLREKLTAARRELAVTRERLTLQRATVGDDELAVKCEADAEQARRASGLVAELRAELARTAPDTVTAALDNAMRTVESLQCRHDEVGEALRDVSAQLKVFGTEGRKGQLDAAATEREHAEAEYSRIHSRARAAQLLRSVMTRHRDATRLRYVDPFRNQVERLGRIVFGGSFEVEIDSELRICSRTLSGRTVPYESLSGGAKEQLGIVARLAGAALVAKEDSVPVIIDDALGFTDAETADQAGCGVRRCRRRRAADRADVQPAAVRQRGHRPPHRADCLVFARGHLLPRADAKCAIFSACRGLLRLFGNAQVRRYPQIRGCV